jgi:cytochrome c
MKHLIASAAIALLAAPAFAEGDPAKGEKAFNKCKSCHTVTTDAGEVIIKGGKTGPNLWGAPGRVAGTYEGFKYGKDLAGAGEAGLTWDEETFVGFVTDPKKFLRTQTGNSKAKSKMSFKLKKGGEDIYAFLMSVSPAPAAAEETATEEAAAEAVTETVSE